MKYPDAFCSKCTWDKETHDTNAEMAKVHDFETYDGHEFDGETDIKVARGAFVFNEYAKRWEGDHTDPETALGDLLADLMHFAKKYDLDFDVAVDNGRYHFDDEIEEANAE